MSGSRNPIVTLVGTGLAPLVEAIPIIEERIGERPIIVGGLADIAEPDEYSTSRLHILAHAWGQETATSLEIRVKQSEVGDAPAGVAANVAEPGPLVAMKLQAIENRSNEKRATDLVNVVRLILDPTTRDTALGQLSTCDPRIGGGVAWYAHKFFSVEITKTFDSVRSISPDIDLDTLQLVGELLAGATIGRVVESTIDGSHAGESSFFRRLSDAIWANPSIATNERLLRLCRESVSSSDESYERLFNAPSELPDLVEAHSEPNRVQKLIDSIERALRGSRR